MAAKSCDYLRGYASLLTVVVTLTYHSQVALADLERVCDTRARPTAGGVCGRNLPIVLSNLCSMFQSRDSMAKVFIKRSAEKIALGDELRGIRLSKKDAFSFFPSKRQDIQRQSILCECCYNQCRLYELLQYCDPNVLNRRQGRSQNAITSRGRRHSVEDSFR